MMNLFTQLLSVISDENYLNAIKIVKYKKSWTGKKRRQTRKF